MHSYGSSPLTFSFITDSITIPRYVVSIPLIFSKLQVILVIYKSSLSLRKSNLFHCTTQYHYCVALVNLTRPGILSVFNLKSQGWWNKQTSDNIDRINNKFSPITNPATAGLLKDVVHGVEYLFPNPSPGRTPVGFQPTGSFLATGAAALGIASWQLNTQRTDGQIGLTVYFAPPTSGSGAEGETLNINRLFSAATGLVTSTTKNVATTTSLTLTPGDWEISGGVNFTTAGGTSVTALYAAVSKTTAALPSTETIANPTACEAWFAWSTAANVMGGSAVTTIAIPPYKGSVSVNTPLFLVANASFTVSTLTCNGYLEARRILPYQVGYTANVTGHLVYA